MRRKFEEQYRDEPVGSPVLRFLYTNRLGRKVLKTLIRRDVSQKARSFFCAPASRLAVKPFIQKLGIDMSEYQDGPYRTFNDFFIRQVKPGARPIDAEPSHLISPCDGKAAAYRIGERSVWRVKGADYSLAALLGDQELAKRYEGGIGLILRLTPDDYHRYCYLDDGRMGERKFIPGMLHTVQPVAERERVFAVNCREYSVLGTENFGPVIQMEVGAILVGKIVNYHENHRFRRGEEKGRFEYGGSTILLFFEKNRVRLRPQIWLSTEQGREVKVKMGQRIGWAIAESIGGKG